MILFKIRSNFCEFEYLIRIIQDWRDTLYDFTGQRDLDSAPLLDFFKPLEDYLDEIIESEGLHLGWSNSTWAPPEELYIDIDKKDDGKSSQIVNYLSLMLILLSLAL